jgi:hypothetical protein
MANLPSVAGRNTLLDIAKSFDPQGKVAKVAELLNQSNEIIQYLPFNEGNLPTGHKAVVRAGLPTVALRQFYKGTPVSKSGRATIEDVCAMLEGRNEIDQDLANLNGNTAAFRMSEALAFIEAMNQQFAKSIIYGDTTTNKDDVLGLAPRFASKSATIQTSANIIDAGGVGTDNTSVWLVVAGQNTVTGIYPKGSQAGLKQEDLGVIDAFDASNNRFRAFAELWQWKYGLHVKDWRYVVRIANIDVSDAVGQTGTQAITAATWLNKLMVRAFARIPSMGMGTPFFLANRTVKEMLSIGAMDKSQNVLAFGPGINQFGTVAPGSVAGSGTGISGGQLSFMGVPVLTCDQILTTEAQIT